MREIKFRARCAFSGVWRYGFYYFSKENHIITDKEGKESIVLEKTVGQFIGLKDKNGKEIYEGDILSYKFWHKEGVGSVAFQDGAFGISTYNKTIELYLFNPFCSYDEPEKDCYPFIEVIGNIYENPELLNQ